MDITSLIHQMLSAATTAAKGHATDLKNYLQTRTKLIAAGTAAIAKDLASNQITKEDAKFAFEEIRKTEGTAKLAVEATLQAAAQDAINAALGVAASAINKAAGFAVI